MESPNPKERIAQRTAELLPRMRRGPARSTTTGRSRQGVDPRPCPTRAANPDVERDTAERPGSGSEGESADLDRRKHLVQCLLTYLAFAWLGLQGVEVLGSIWGWPLVVQKRLTMGLAAGVVPAMGVAWVRSSARARKICGPEAIIIALTLLGLAVGVKLATFLPH